MQYTHQKALKKPVMLRHASQTSCVMQNVHDNLQTQTYWHLILVKRLRRVTLLVYRRELGMQKKNCLSVNL